jgi:hypothetical protein
MSQTLFTVGRAPKANYSMESLSESLRRSIPVGPDPIGSYYPLPVPHVVVYESTLAFWAARAEWLEKRIAELESAMPFAALNT